MIFISTAFYNKGFAQIIPIGMSYDSVVVLEKFLPQNIQGFYLYKPSNYNPGTSPIWFVMHGQGGDGAGTINNLSNIGDRRGALMVGLNFQGVGSLMQHQNAIVPCLDSSAAPANAFCAYYLPGTLVLKKIYNYLCQRENRNSIPCYMSGFSAGAQFVSRYMSIRQSYPDSIPIQMSLSMSPLGYTFPTDTFLGVAQPYVCGMIMPQPFGGACPHSFNFFGWNCNEHIIQYYNDNYAVCVGDQDVANQLNGSCYDITGATRLERARTFYAFCDSNAVTRGTTLNWQYAEIPGAGHNEYDCFQTKWLPTDTSTIAERILFETPYHAVQSIAPVAYFYPEEITINANDTVFFNNVSLNASSYYWEFGDSTYATSTQVNPYHVYAMPGLYSVELTAINSAGCDNWFIRRNFIHVQGSVSVSELEFGKMEIFPNPTTGSFKMKIEKGYQHGLLRIYSMEGRLVLEQHHSGEKELNLRLPEKVSTGLYLLSWETEAGKLTKKLVVSVD